MRVNRSIVSGQSYLVFLMVCCLLAVSCSSESRAKSSFKKMVTERYEKLLKANAEVGEGIVKGDYIGFSYDVQKTDSTVRPFRGIYTVNFRTRNILTGTDEIWHTTDIYEYEDGTWHFKTKVESKN